MHACIREGIRPSDSHRPLLGVLLGRIKNVFSSRGPGSGGICPGLFCLRDVFSGEMFRGMSSV